MQNRLGGAGANTDIAVVAPRAKANQDNEVLIPAGYESTYCQERQKEEKWHRSETLKCHLEKREAEKQEVLSHGHRYVSRRTWEIKDNLRPMNEIV